MANWYVNGNLSVGIWAKKSGAWQKITNRIVFVYQSVPGSGLRTVNWFLNDIFDLGTGVQAFGVTIESYSGNAAAVTDLASVSWTAQSASGERSATPSDQSTTAVVSPQ